MSQEIDPQKPKLCKTNPALSPFNKIYRKRLIDELTTTLAQPSKEAFNKSKFSRGFDPYMAYALCQKGLLSLTLATADKIDEEKNLEFFLTSSPEAKDIQAATFFELNYLRRGLRFKLGVRYSNYQLEQELHEIGKQGLKLRLQKVQEPKP